MALSASNSYLFSCQQAHGGPIRYISGFANQKELYQKIAQCYGFSPEDILFCTLNTNKVDVKRLVGAQIAPSDFVYAHRKGRPKVVEIPKTEDDLGIDIQDNGAGYLFIKWIAEESIAARNPYIEIGDHIVEIVGENVVGRRPEEVEELLQKIQIGTTFTIHLVEPLKDSCFKATQDQEDVLRQNANLFEVQEMRAKIQRSFLEFSVLEQTLLQHSLTLDITRWTPDNSKVLLTELCLALADLVLQMTAWRDCIRNIFGNFYLHHSWAFLETFTVLPREVDSTVLKLGENLRLDIKSELKIYSGKVMSFLGESFPDHPQAALKIIKCLTSWVQIIDIKDVPNYLVIYQCFNVLADCNAMADLHEAAAECVVTLLRSLDDTENNEDVKKQLFNGVASLEIGYHMAAANNKQEIAMNYSWVFAELAEKFMLPIINCAQKREQHYSFKSLDLALIWLEHNSYEVAELTFKLWRKLSDELYERELPELTNEFRPHVERLVEQLTRVCRMKPDHIGLLVDSDPFYKFRLKVLDLITDVIFIIDADCCFKWMLEKVQAPGISWEETEARLFVMRAVAGRTTPEENEVVLQFVNEIVADATTKHVAFRKTCVLLLGDLCQWIEFFSERLLLPALQYLEHALHDKDLASNAATALQSIFKACDDHMIGYKEVLLTIVGSLDTRKLSEEAAIGLLRGVGAIISRLDAEQMTAAMREAASVQLSALELLVQTESSAVEKGTANDPVIWLDRLTALFREIKPMDPEEFSQHSCLPAIRNSWFIISLIIDKYRKDRRVMEHLCRTLRYVLPSIKVQEAQLLAQLVDKMVQVYSKHKHSGFLYLGSVLVDKVAHVPILKDMLQALIPKAMAFLQENGLKENPDTAGRLFLLCHSFLHCAPLPLLRSPELLPSIMRCALSASSLNDEEANSSVMEFFYELILIAQSRPPPRHPKAEKTERANRTLEKYGEELVYSLLCASVFHLDEYLLPEVGRVLAELAAWQRPRFKPWLYAALQRLQEQAAGAMAHATPPQIEQFYDYSVKAETSTAMTRLLRNFLKLYR